MSACSKAACSAASPASGSSERLIARDRQLVRLERDEVAHGLGIDERAERLVPAVDLEVVWMVRGQLQKAADRCAALVLLAGRMQEARSEADGHGTAGLVAQQRGDVTQRRGTRVRWRDIGLQREVAVLARARQVTAQLGDETAVRTGQPQRRVTAQAEEAFRAERLVRGQLVIVLVLRRARAWCCPSTR